VAVPPFLSQTDPTTFMDPFLLAAEIDRYLREDLAFGDLTSEAIFHPEELGVATFVAKSQLITAGMSSVASQVFSRKNAAINCKMAMEDGKQATVGDILLVMEGPVLDLLAAERVALNLVQRLCGIATLTSRYVEAIIDYPVRVTDTRKTTPGLRVLEKYAVRAGGGANHRLCLSDGVLIKDNHIAACGSIERAVRRVRDRMPHTLKIEVEATTLDEVRQCLNCGVDIILLDNMEPSMMRDAVQMVDGSVLLEASGGITLENIREVAATGVDLISVGALTHSAPASDISMRIEVKS